MKGRRIDATIPIPLLAEVAQAPTGPGCYLFRDLEGKAIYVGKAVQLRRRLRSYFNRPGRPQPDDGRAAW